MFIVFLDLKGEIATGGLRVEGAPREAFSREEGTNARHAVKTLKHDCFFWYTVLCI